MTLPLRRALLLIDFQHDFLADDGRLPVDRSQVQPVVESARAAIERAHGVGDLIVRAGNEFGPTTSSGTHFATTPR